MTTIPVNGPAPYQVTIDHDLDAAVADCAAATGAAKVMVIHQPTLVAPAEKLGAALAARGLEVVLAPVPDAEEGKTLDVAGALWDRLGAETFGRRDAIVGLGGGAVTDLAGFVAAAWMRGIKVIQVPTTLLAMVDAAVGGKTGINTAAGKNLVGAFHEPTAVFIDLDRLETLPEAEIVAGSAEIIKTGFIADPVILERYEEDPAACLRGDGHLPELIARSVTVKADVVGQDLKESGLREILNYGHTFGHAVELRENYRWRHGHAVGVGMMFIAHLAANRGLIDAGLVERHRRILESVGLSTTYPAGHFEELYAAMTRDKKNRDGNIRFVALTGVGETTRLEGPSTDELRAAYEAISGEK
ncbi:3-dehydroquinate synthase [Corynebacterium sp. YIM 101645]|uniref:3-dehydroquinate synthase n=1 Tax=Corynebacterium lemuris TaxID=1859292 RepID=A0ABT2G075_9CORY|nr:3-dehydroquinate synthase [Corynebacterium lemuris]